MTSSVPGISTSPVEVSNISKHGFWLLLGDEELFLPFSEFPWFRDVPVGKILHVEFPSAGHLYSTSRKISVGQPGGHLTTGCRRSQSG